MTKINNHTGIILSEYDMDAIIYAHLVNQDTPTWGTAEKAIEREVADDFIYASGKHHEIGYNKYLEMMLSKYNDGKKLLRKFNVMKENGEYTIYNR